MIYFWFQGSSERGSMLVEFAGRAVFLSIAFIVRMSLSTSCSIIEAIWRSNVSNLMLRFLKSKMDMNSVIFKDNGWIFFLNLRMDFISSYSMTFSPLGHSIV